MADLQRTYMWLYGCFVSLVAAVLYVYCTASPYWYRIAEDPEAHGGLWYECERNFDVDEISCNDILLVGVQAYIHFARAFMIISSLLILCTLWTLVVAHVVKVLSNKLKIAGIVIMTSTVPVLIATVMYWSLKSDEMEKEHLNAEASHAVILGWVSIPIALVGGALLVVEHKRLLKQQGYLKL
ncbi:peripheral myelin protein 22-like [Ptychodera flava]|uniref:peripheral myelin protein 22-like n=1 Tax=Ptychodera flava TaxID=63121 RepID=UPI00396A455E